MSLLERWIRGPESPDISIQAQILVTFVLLWLPLVVLTIIEGTFAGDKVAQPFLWDIVPHVRFLVAIPLLLIAGVYIDPATRAVTRDTESSGIVPQEEQAKFQAMLAGMRRGRDSVWPDIAIIALAITATWLLRPVTGDPSTQAMASSWTWTVDSGDVRYSAAAWWYLLVSGPMFLILLLRWLWRFLLWSGFLFQASRLSLVLRPSHPDLSGGLGLLGLAQQSFVVVFLAFTCVTSSTIASDILAGNERLREAVPEILILTLLILVVIYLPLYFFSKRMILARRAGLDRFGSLGYRLSTAFDKRWLNGDENATGSGFLDSADPSALADCGAVYENVRRMRPVPASMRNMATVAGLLLAPYLPLLLTTFSIQDLAKRLIESLI